MSIYFNVTQDDLDNLRKLAQQQKEQRAIKIKNKLLKQTHDKNLAESLSPITDKLEETSKNLGNVITENDTPQLAIENTPQPVIENNEGTIYDVELENTLNKMIDNTGFFKTQHKSLSGWILNNVSIGTPGGTEVDISGNKYDITPGLQKVFIDTKYGTVKSTEKIVFRGILSETGYYNRKPTKRRMSGRDRYIKNDLDNDVRRILDIDKKLKGRGVERIIIPSNMIDIYTRLELLLGLKLIGHTDTLTEASNLIVELYNQGEIRNKQQYRNALNKFSN